MAFRIQNVSVSAYRPQWKKLEHSGDVFRVIFLCEIRPLDLCKVAPVYPGRAVCVFLFPLLWYLHPRPVFSSPSCASAEPSTKETHRFRFSSLFGRMIWRAQSRMVSLEGQDERCEGKRGLLAWVRAKWKQGMREA